MSYRQEPLISRIDDRSDPDHRLTEFVYTSIFRLFQTIDKLRQKTASERVSSTRTKRIQPRTIRQPRTTCQDGLSIAIWSTFKLFHLDCPSQWLIMQLTTVTPRDHHQRGFEGADISTVGWQKLRIRCCIQRRLRHFDFVSWPGLVGFDYVAVRFSLIEGPLSYQSFTLARLCSQPQTRSCNITAFLPGPCGRQ